MTKPTYRPGKRFQTKAEFLAWKAQQPPRPPRAQKPLVKVAKLGVAKRSMTAIVCKELAKSLAARVESNITFRPHTDSLTSSNLVVRHPNKSMIKFMFWLEGKTLQIKQGKVYIQGNVISGQWRARPLATGQRMLRLDPSLANEVLIDMDNPKSMHELEEWLFKRIDLYVAKPYICDAPPPLPSERVAGPLRPITP